ncbi:hypothetical protein GIB67_003541 [Kingdonia uniflora]|uniref:DUF4408 domain-containing protein n=1 Tax=Kingdonia uniflora TaxID=39325 RepID=A0A7J7MEQ8_9MAGN|nr:hypothetical protein GIB67_003541 [Kingdonia uniflora]
MVDSKRFQTVIWTVKLALLSIGIVSTFLLLKVAIPYSCSVVVSAPPKIWASFKSWLSPLYLYILVNFIIIGIAVSSFHQKGSEEAEAKKKVEKEEVLSDSGGKLWLENGALLGDSGEKAVVKLVESSLSLSLLSESETSCVSSITEESGSGGNRQEELSVSSARNVMRKPKQSYRRSVSSIAHSTTATSKLRKVQKLEEGDENTLDATWKSITEGRGEPVTRQLKKSDTWNLAPAAPIKPELEQMLAQRELRKSETFNDTASLASSGSNSSGSSGGLGRESSLSQDELNRRVEAFIKKINNDIRLQRQESYERYNEMVNRGVY